MNQEGKFVSKNVPPGKYVLATGHPKLGARIPEVEVKEEGTEAASATGVVMSRMAVMRSQPTPIFRADHPFLFLIRDHQSGRILFRGRIGPSGT